jgi:transposase-like protein
MILEPIHCPRCNEIEVIKHGKTAQGKQRYRCQQMECERGTFICDYSYAGYSLPWNLLGLCNFIVMGGVLMSDI